MLRILIFLLSALCSLASFSDILRDEYASDNGTYLDERDNETLKKLNRFEKGAQGGFAIMPGTVRFTYGNQIPTVVCAILELTDIAMERQEHINSVQLGDGARWSVEFAKSGSESNFVEHLIVKPLDSGLKTSLIVTTDRRTYHIRLKSTASDFMQSVHFYYPQSNKNNFESQSSFHNTYDNTYKTQDKPYENTSALTSNTVGGSSASVFSSATFNYSVLDNCDDIADGYYSQGRSIINIKHGADFEEEPVLYSIQKDASGQKQKTQVNYRIHGKNIIIDGSFNELLLQVKMNGDVKTIRMVR